MSTKALPQQLPALQSLIHFESAARHLNFTSAAEELGATQPAVSLRIRKLEDELGLPLFDRLHRGVRLTHEGERLLETVQQTLEALRLVTADMRTQQSRRTLTLSTDFGFAKLWLLPRMVALRQAIPELQLRVLTSQSEPDARVGVPDLSVIFGECPDAGSHRLLFAESVVPVCSPALLRHGLPTPRELAAMPLLQLEQHGPTARWMSWADWFRGRGQRAPAASDAITFNDYSLVVQAAVSGLGVALGWAPLVDDLLASGELVQADAQPLQTSRGYFLSTLRPWQSHGLQGRFCDWLVAECARTTALRNLPPR
ncbi:LysR substrate-binding domain-containing protein [Roseateles chitinivorans]|uniref:LysR substrate-binding domain-containing protein n=1 Tax=Roseateles chitinivorans TaxID=2917965 RepID=UPI003D66DC57